MKLVAKFFGNTVEGDFETSQDNWENEKLLKKIKKSHEVEVRRIFNTLIKEIGILNPEYEKVKDDFFAWILTNEYINEDEMRASAREQAIKNGYTAPIFNQYTPSKQDIYENPEFVAIVSLGKDTATDHTNYQTKVEIFKK